MRTDGLRLLLIVMMWCIYSFYIVVLLLSLIKTKLSGEDQDKNPSVLFVAFD